MSDILREDEPFWASTDLSYLSKEEAENGSVLQKKMLEVWQRNPLLTNADETWNLAVRELGNVGRYEDFTVCTKCGQMYHVAYSSNSDPDRDFCKTECEWAWLQDNPGADYDGELLDEEEKY